MSIEKSLDGRLLRIALNRPEKRNALSIGICREIVAALNEANDNPAIGAVLLSGNGKAFCAGMDLNEAPGADPNELAAAHDPLFTFYEWITKPTVAAVHGPAIAGGTGLAANAHIVVAAEDATFGLTEVRLGLWPVLIYPAIAAAVGNRRALELALSGRIFDAREAERFGLVSEVTPTGQHLARAVEIAQGLANASSSAIRSGLEYVRLIRGKETAESIRTGRLVRDQIMQHPDFAEGIQAFRDKRAPVWPSHHQ